MSELHVVQINRDGSWVGRPWSFDDNTSEVFIGRKPTRMLGSYGYIEIPMCEQDSHAVFKSRTDAWVAGTSSFHGVRECDQWGRPGEYLDYVEVGRNLPLPEGQGALLAMKKEVLILVFVGDESAFFDYARQVRRRLNGVS